MKKLAIIFILFFGQIIYSQQTNISHTVVSGETLSKIAQKYSVTPYDIIKLNPNAASGIKENDVLIIPVSVNSASKTPVSSPSATQQVLKKSSGESPIISIHIVQSGETKYGISKLYGVTIPQLEEQNPHIVPGLQAGHKLKISNATTGYKQDLSQSSVTFRSKFDYVVLPGETLYGISKRNGLTVDQLTKANASVLKGVLKSGQHLTIPVLKETSLATSSYASSVDSKYHIVEPKETKFGLSKKCGVTIEQLENLNPHIVNGLQIGHRITIPASYTGKEEEVNSFASKTVKETVSVEKNKETKPVAEEKSDKINLNQEYVDYEIQPKETLFGLSKKAGMSVSDFIELNPKLENAVQIGMVIKMPKEAISVSAIPTDVVSPNVVEKKKVAEVSNTTVAKFSGYKDLRLTVNKSVKKQIALVVPFGEAKYQDYLSKYSTFEGVKDEFLKDNLEFYSGALKAIDSAKTLGLNFDVKLIELPKDEINQANEAKLKEANLSKINAVVLPYFENIAEKIASDISVDKVPVITNHLTNEGKGYSNLYLSVPSEAFIKKRMLEYLKSKTNNVIVINSNGREESKNAISTVFPEAKYAKISDRNVLDTDDLKSTLVKDKINYVILDTDKNSMIISSTNVLLNELSDYEIQIVVLEPSLLSNYENVSSIRINILKMIYPSYSSVEKSAQLNNSVKRIIKEDKIEPTDNFLIGFDLTMDTLLRISQDKDFETSAKEDITEYLKLKFDYKKDKEGSTINKGFYILQHDTDNKIKELN